MTSTQTDDVIVEARELGRRFQGKAVVSGLTFNLAPGGIHGFVGANGGGKTTALHVLAGALAPSEGAARVLGIDIATNERVTLRRRVGFMTQSFSLFPDLTARENLQFRADTLDLPHTHVAISNALREFGLEAHADRRADRLSGGWARRLHLAATLLSDPPLVLLDEPTAGLDVSARLETWALLEHRARAGLTIVVATHDLSEAQRCNSISLFLEGRVGVQASPLAMIEASGLSAWIVKGATMAGLEGVTAIDAIGGAVRILTRKNSPAEMAASDCALRSDSVTLEDVVRQTLTQIHP